MSRRSTNKRIPASKRELAAFDLTDIEIETFLKDRATLEEAVRISRESRLLTRLKAEYPCGRCLKVLGEKQGLTWDRNILAWVHVRCPNRRPRA